MNEFRHRQRAAWLDHGALAMYPFRFNRIQPRTLAGQVEHEEATAALAFHAAIVLADPLSNLLTGVPRRIVPNQNQDAFAPCRLLLGHPVQILTGDLAEGALCHKA